MAKKSSINKNLHRRDLAGKYASRRKKLKAVIMDRLAPAEERFAAVLKLAELPRNGAPNRIRNRCEVSGRPRGFIVNSKCRALHFGIWHRVGWFLG